MTELSVDETINMALEIAKEGGGQGRAIVCRFIWAFGHDKPEKALEIMNTILPRMPEVDRNAVLFTLDEIGRTLAADLPKVIEDALDTGVPSLEAKDLIVKHAMRNGKTERAIITRFLIQAYNKRDRQLIEYIENEVLSKMHETAREGVEFVVGEFFAADALDVEKIVNERMDQMAMTFVKKFTDRFNPS